MTKKKAKKLRGDKIRDLILLIYLNEKYGGGRVRISILKRTLGYSTGGIYNALDESGYFIRKGDIVTLSKIGDEYIRKYWIPYLQVVNPFSYFMILIGSLLFLSWYLRVCHGLILIFDWYQGIVMITVGLIVRFAFPRLMYWTLKFKKKL